MKFRSFAVLLAIPLLMSALPAPQAAAKDSPNLTIATFNASLNRAEEGQLVTDLSTPDNEQARNAAETIQRAGADIVLVNEFDYTEGGEAVDLFRENYLEVSQNGAPTAEYPYAWTGPVNTGVPSGQDLNNDGEVGGPDDALGFGEFPGQYGLVVYSKYPIEADQVRTFQNFLWKDMPDALLPEDPETGEPFYSDEALDVLPLSSKTHADIPVNVDGEILHVLAAHPTPPSFDGPEKRNQRRNFDEIRLWADYIGGSGDYLYDDQGGHGGLAEGSNFVILGDYNSDENDGDSWPGAISQLLDSPVVLDPKPRSDGAVEADSLQGNANANHLSDPQYDTADFNDDPAPGNIRVDYTLLSNGTMEVHDSGVFWPTSDDPLSRLTGEYPFPTSDHRLVWVKTSFLGGGSEPTPTPGESPTPTPAPSESPEPTPGGTPSPSGPPTPGDTPPPGDQKPPKDGKRPGLPDTGR